MSNNVKISFHDTAQYFTKHKPLQGIDEQEKYIKRLQERDLRYATSTKATRDYVNFVASVLHTPAVDPGDLIDNSKLYKQAAKEVINFTQMSRQIARAVVNTDLTDDEKLNLVKAAVDNSPLTEPEKETLLEKTVSEISELSNRSEFSESDVLLSNQRSEFLEESDDSNEADEAPSEEEPKSEKSEKSKGKGKLSRRGRPKKVIQFPSDESSIDWSAETPVKPIPPVKPKGLKIPRRSTRIDEEFETIDLQDPRQPPELVPIFKNTIIDLGQTKRQGAINEIINTIKAIKESNIEQNREKLKAIGADKFSVDDAAKYAFILGAKGLSAYRSAASKGPILKQKINKKDLAEIINVDDPRQVAIYYMDKYLSNIETESKAVNKRVNELKELYEKVGKGIGKHVRKRVGKSMKTQKHNSYHNINDYHKTGAGVFLHKDYDSMKNRLKVMVGSIRAGNNSNSLKHESKQLADYLLKNKKITQTDYNKIRNIIIR